MTIHLNKFVDRVRGHEARCARDFVMSMNDARDLHADITRLLLELHAFKEQAVAQPQEQVITVQLSGRPF